MKVPDKFPVFAIVFSIVCSIVYVVAVEKNYAMFTYHPATGQWSAGVEKAGPDGPAMYWFGWIATSTLAGFIAGLIACLLPRSVGERLSPALSWAAPLVCILVLAYILRNFFLR